MNEAKTRAELIEPALCAAGRSVVEDSRIQRKSPITNGRIPEPVKRGKAQIADYVLVFRSTKLAVI